MAAKKTEEIAITVENFDALAEKYAPLIKKNISLVFRIHNKDQRLAYEDLYQEGLMALWDSVKKFDPIKFPGVFFGVYLKVAIQNQLKCYARDYLPAIYKKDYKKTLEKGKPMFKRIPITVLSYESDLDLEIKTNWNKDGKVRTQSKSDY